MVGRIFACGTNPPYIRSPHEFQSSDVTDMTKRLKPSEHPPTTPGPQRPPTTPGTQPKQEAPSLDYWYKKLNSAKVECDDFFNIFHDAYHRTGNMTHMIVGKLEGIKDKMGDMQERNTSLANTNERLKTRLEEVRESNKTIQEHNRLLREKIDVLDKTIHDLKESESAARCQVNEMKNTAEELLRTDTPNKSNAVMRRMRPRYNYN